MRVHLAYISKFGTVEQISGHLTEKAYDKKWEVIGYKFIVNSVTRETMTIELDRIDPKSIVVEKEPIPQWVFTEKKTSEVARRLGIRIFHETKLKL